MNVDPADAIKQACQYIENSQWPQGFWIDFELSAGMSSQWVTAYIAHSLAYAGGSLEIINRARDWLLRTRFEGGWGFNRSTPIDADSTANVLLFFSRYCRNEVGEKALEDIANQLISFSTPTDGGFFTYQIRSPAANQDRHEYMFDGSGWCISHPSVTAMAIEALWSVDRTKYDDVTRDAVSYIKNQQSADGYWNCYWWYGPLYVTYWVSRILCAIDDFEGLTRAVDWVKSSCNEDGGWGYVGTNDSAAFFTALAASTLMLSDESSNIEGLIEDGMTWIVKNQQPDGSWQSVPILLNPIPEVQESWKDNHPSCLNPYVDQNRLFTTATALHCLAAYQRMSEHASE